MRTFIILSISILCFVFITKITINIFGSLKTEVVTNQKVIKLQQQNLIKGSGSVDTEIRYLIITDKETFICKNSLLNGKFNNSDIFFRLKEDSIYTFKVCGVGKNIFSDYRNILEVIE